MTVCQITKMDHVLDGHVIMKNFIKTVRNQHRKYILKALLTCCLS